MTPKMTNMESITSGSVRWNCDSKWTDEGIPQVTTHFRKLQPGPIYLLPQQLSYPMCGLNDRQARMYNNHPRADYLMKAAKMAGAEMHTIFIHRDLDDIMETHCANDAHFKYDSCPGQAETLAKNTEWLVSQLAIMDPSEYSCLRFGDMINMQKTVREVFGNDNKTKTNGKKVNKRSVNHLKPLPNKVDESDESDLISLEAMVEKTFHKKEHQSPPEVLEQHEFLEEAARKLEKACQSAGNEIGLKQFLGEQNDEQNDGPEASWASWVAPLFPN